MSMVSCDKCGDPIDSDMDLDCFVEVSWLNLEDRIWCEECREFEWNKHEKQTA